MMDIMVPETCSASNKVCNKNHLLHLVGILFPHINLSTSGRIRDLFVRRVCTRNDVLTRQREEHLLAGRLFAAYVAVVLTYKKAETKG